MIKTQREKPILMNTKMVQAILSNRKTCTRRVIKYSCPTNPENTLTDFIGDSDPQILIDCAPYTIGDILYVRETWRKWTGGYRYKADAPAYGFLWKPSIHMPREAARLFLRVTDVRVERLQDITAEQCCQEGITADFPYAKPAYISVAYTEIQLKPAIKSEFIKLWNSTIKPAYLPCCGWDANPWVWAIHFERITKPA